MRAAEQGGSTIRRVSTAGNRQIRLELLASIEEKLKRPPLERLSLGSGVGPSRVLVSARGQHQPDYLIAFQLAHERLSDLKAGLGCTSSKPAAGKWDRGVKGRLLAKRPASAAQRVRSRRSPDPQLAHLKAQ